MNEREMMMMMKKEGKKETCEDGWGWKEADQLQKKKLTRERKMVITMIYKMACVRVRVLQSIAYQEQHKGHYKPCGGVSATGHRAPGAAIKNMQTHTKRDENVQA